MSSLKIIQNSENSFEFCQSVEKFYDTYMDLYKESSDKLKSLPCINITNKIPAIYIRQQEYSVVPNKHDLLTHIGTDMATTCHIVILQTKKLTALGHFDGSSTQQGIDDMCQDILNLSNEEINEIYVHVIGGFDDYRGLSHELTKSIIHEFCTYGKRHKNTDIAFILKTFCCTVNNDVIKEFVHDGKIDEVELINFPVITGVVVDLHSGKIQPAVFDNDAMGPATQLRGALVYRSNHVMNNIYNAVKGCFEIKEFSYTPVKDALLWIAQPNEIIRKYMSTSPDAEPPNFEDNTRSTLLFMHNNPDSKEIFKNKDSLLYEPYFHENIFKWRLCNS